MSQPNTAPAINMNTNAPKPKKLVGIWRHRLITGFLGFVILAILVGAAVGGWYLWRQSESRRQEVNTLQDKVESLEKERNLSASDLQTKLDAQTTQINDLIAENKRLNDELTSAKAKVDQLTPKNIRDVNFKTLKKINEPGGDVWLNPVFADITGDGKEDAIYAYRLAGAGGFLNVYVYSYLDTNTLTEILKAEGYQKGTVSFIADQKNVEIKSEAGTPDAPQIASTKFKFDAGTKKMVKI
jgi:cell division protein FtsB